MNHTMERRDTSSGPAARSAPIRRTTTSSSSSSSSWRHHQRPQKQQRNSRRATARGSDASMISLLSRSSRWVVCIMMMMLLYPHQQQPLGCSAQSTTTTTTTNNHFNYEVEKRIIDRLAFYLGDPIATNTFIANYRRNGGFTHAMQAADRDAYLTLAYSLEQPLVYYGLEDGTCLGYFLNYGYYREPGNSGFDMDDPAMQHYARDACIDPQTGQSIECRLAVGDQYIRWVTDSETGAILLGPCTSDTTNQTAAEDEEDVLLSRQECRSEDECRQQQTDEEAETTTTKWCRQYTIENTTTTTSNLGYIPMTSHCHAHNGQFTETPGQTIPERSIDGNCYFADGTTRVDRAAVAGPFAYCGRNDSDSSTTTTTTTTAEYNTCAGTFTGGYESNNYDPRYRPWYTNTKRLQRPNWSPPYPFFQLGIGVTYSYPIYDDEIVDDEEEDTDELSVIDSISSSNANTTTTTKRRQVFAGVAAIDYRFEDIAEFLMESYGNTSTLIAVYEADAPNYVIGVSTGSPAATNRLVSDESQSCPIQDGNNVAECNPVRVTMTELGLASTGSSSTLMDHDDANNRHANDNAILVRAFHKHEQAGYQSGSLLSVPVSDTDFGDGIYVTQSALYEQSGANLKWRVLISQTGRQSDADAVTANGSPLIFFAIVVIASIGVVTCTSFVYLFYQRRHCAAVIRADWRFTSAFIVGCALLNVSLFALLGPNTDVTCQLRTWTFHLFAATALSPLFVKIWRMKQLVGRTSIRRVTISNKKTALYTLPLILIQLVILTIFTFVDPRKQTEIISNQDGVITQQIVCSAETNAFFIVEMIFSSSLIVIGCILAYMTRHVDERFGESKQLIFAMYNIASVALIVVVVFGVSDMSLNGKKLLHTIAIFWTTVLSSGVFVLPRMMQIRSEANQSGTHSSVQVSFAPQVGGDQNDGAGNIAVNKGVRFNSDSMLESIRETKSDCDDGEEGRGSAADASGDVEEAASHEHYDGPRRGMEETTTTATTDESDSCYDDCLSSDVTRIKMSGTLCE